MILAAAVCAAAGISYIFNDDEQSITNDKYIEQDKSIVTASSTIVDKQGIIKYVIYPRIRNSFQRILFINEKLNLNQFKIPIEINEEKKNSIGKQERSLVFFWSIPLKARMVQVPTKSCFMIENLNPFQRHSMKISIGTQNEINENIGISHLQSYTPSEIALSNYDDTLDALSYNPMLNEDVIPIGILKKKRLDMNNRDNNQKRFCYEKRLDSDDEKIMRNMILNNVNQCVENLSKILSETCSDNQEELTTLQNSTKIISSMNNNNQKSSIKHDIYENIHSKLFEHEENLNYHDNRNADIDIIEKLSDGVILHRGKQFGLALGEPMARKYENLHTNSYHSINELNRLLSSTNCLLMRQYEIESIEDLIRLFLEQGQHHFTELMINLFKVDPFIVEQLNSILIKWAKKLA